MDCSCGVCTNIDGPKSSDVGVGVGVAPCAEAVVYGITYCDCSTGYGLHSASGECADIDEPSPPDTADRVESGEGVSFGGLLAGDLMTPPFVPPNADRSWISSGKVIGVV